MRKNFQTIVVDPRGIDRPSKAEGVLTAEQWADDFAALLGALRLPAAHVLGSSHGGSMAMALRRPDVVRSLLLFGAFSELDRFIVLNMDLRIRLAKKIGMGEHLSLPGAARHRVAACARAAAGVKRAYSSSPPATAWA